MKKRYLLLLRVSAALLAFAMILPAVSCSDKEPADTSAEESTEAPAEAPLLISGGKTAGPIIRGTDMPSGIVSAASALARMIREIDPDVSYAEDFATRDTADNPDFELLIGKTNRPASIRKLAELRARDYFIGMYEGKLLIIGGSDSSTVTAVEEFSAMLGELISGQSDLSEIRLGFLSEPILHTEKYAAEVIKIGDKKMNEYSIKYASGADRASIAANYLADYISSLSGTVVTCKPTVSKTDPEATVIVGNTGSETAEGLRAALSGTIPFSVTEKDGRLYLSGRDYWGMCAAAKYLVDNFIASGTDVPSGFSYYADAAGTLVFGRTEGTSLRIMTNNCWNRDTNNADWTAMGGDCSADFRSTDLALTYLSCAPDIICFQEMTPKMMKLLREKMSAQGLTYKLLRREDKDFTSMLYNPETVTLIDSGFHLFSYGNDAQSKGYTWGCFEHTASGKRFIAMSTHWWWKGESAEPGSDEMRRKQAAEIVAEADKLIAKYDCPVFVEGDFNCRIDAPGYKQIASGGFSDCHDIAASADDTSGYHTCTTTTYNTTLRTGGYASGAIDHMMVKNAGSFEIRAFRQPVTDFFWKLTDHIPAYIDIKIPQ